MPGDVAQGGKLLAHAPPIVVSQSSSPLAAGSRDHHHGTRLELPLTPSEYRGAKERQGIRRSPRKPKPSGRLLFNSPASEVLTTPSKDSNYGHTKAFPYQTNRKKRIGALNEKLQSNQILVTPSESVQPGSVLELEDWEISPGRIRESSGAMADSKPHRLRLPGTRLTMPF